MKREQRFAVYILRRFSDIDIGFDGTQETPVAHDGHVGFDIYLRHVLEPAFTDAGIGPAGSDDIAEIVRPLDAAEISGVRRLGNGAVGAVNLVAEYVAEILGGVQ